MTIKLLDRFHRVVAVADSFYLTIAKHKAYVIETIGGPRLRFTKNRSGAPPKGLWVRTLFFFASLYKNSYT